MREMTGNRFGRSIVVVATLAFVLITPALGGAAAGGQGAASDGLLVMCVKTQVAEKLVAHAGFSFSPPDGFPPVPILCPDGKRPVFKKLGK